MASRRRQVSALDEIIGRKKEDLKKLQIEIAALEEARRHTLGVADQASSKKRAARSDVKTFVLGLLEEVGRGGLVAATAVELAAKRNVHLERGTVSSLLSRLKGDGAVRYDGTVYRLAKFGNDPSAPLGDKAEASVHPFPASKIAP